MLYGLRISGERLLGHETKRKKSELGWILHRPNVLCYYHTFNAKYDLYVTSLTFPSNTPIFPPALRKP